MTPSRGLWTAIGLILLGIGIVGYLVPGLPGTVFLILALYCFQNGSMKLHSWMLRNRLFGPTLRDWDENKWISKRVKIIAIASMWVFGIGSCYSNPSILMISIVGSLCVLGTWYVASRPTKPSLRVIEAEVVSSIPRASGQ